MRTGTCIGSQKENDRPIAFVLMKFLGDPWNDPTYKGFCEVVEEAGYSALRADQIHTSGPVVDEVCRLIHESPLLLIDTTGDSPSVSYELGYAHGVGRSHDKTIVLRSGASGPIPFNYAHFRLLVYRDLRHLKRSLRSWLRLSTPLLDDDLGFAMNFSIATGAGEYGIGVALATLNALKTLRFSGRCEYYAGNPIVPGEPFYIVALALRDIKGATPKYEWWQKLAGLVSATLAERKSKVVLNTVPSEMGEVGGIRRHYPSRGVAELVNGKVTFVLGDGHSDESWFSMQCQRQMIAAGQNATLKEN
jgi:hypothetical protein